MLSTESADVMWSRLIKNNCVNENDTFADFADKDNEKAVCKVAVTGEDVVAARCECYEDLSEYQPGEAGESAAEVL